LGKRYATAYALHKMGPGYFKRDGLHRYDTDERFIETLPVEWLVIGFSEPYDPERFDYPKWLRAHPDRLNFWEPKNGRPLRRFVN
jgi:hypothetical protein